jgi:hypothetical protein
MRTRLLLAIVALSIGAMQGCHHKKGGGGGYLRPAPSIAR